MVLDAPFAPAASSSRRRLTPPAPSVSPPPYQSPTQPTNLPSFDGLALKLDKRKEKAKLKAFYKKSGLSGGELEHAVNIAFAKKESGKSSFWL